MNRDIARMNRDHAHNATPIELLLVEDSAGDVRPIREALRAAEIRNNLSVLSDGIEAMSFLQRGAGYADLAQPDLMLLDLNLPRMSGTEVLESIRNSEMLRHIQ